MDILGVASPEFVHAYRALPSVVLEADMGRRKITWFWLARAAGSGRAIIAYYLIKTPLATGGGLGLELALAALGIVPGVAAGMIFRVFRGADGFPRSPAGSPTQLCGSWWPALGSDSPTPPVIPATCRRGISRTTSPPTRSPMR
jgi:hypothetical protein